MLNLIVNAIQSMSGVEDGNRELHISTVSIEPEGCASRCRIPAMGCARRACRVSLSVAVLSNRANHDVSPRQHGTDREHSPLNVLEER